MFIGDMVVEVSASTQLVGILITNKAINSTLGRWNIFYNVP